MIIAPHHGANNGSSMPFIQAVDPTHVIFSAGRANAHPRQATADRYRTHGVLLDNMFRTDLGDSEGGDEWSHGAGTGPEPIGDDDVEIRIDDTGDVTVRFVP